MTANDNEHAHGHEGGPIVEVVNLNTNDEVKFHADWADTVGQVWTRAYEELKEARGERDQFECQDGTPLMEHLNLTLRELQDRHLCIGRKFQIRGETGGA